MPVYPGYVVCPSCRGIAANITIPLFDLIYRLEQRPDQIDRTLLRTDQDKPGPSKHLVVCQHCHFPFRASEGQIVGKPRVTTP